ncbi:MAG: lamin tail domain-containing protein, partial [Candidatus Portnoybacteria bacterium]|nr:lamin tail domain-containing protein [Candidatus Portnoybacteria bacterium]
MVKITKTFLAFLLFIILYSLFFILVAFAAGEVVISEIAWMGTKTSANDEWIELASVSGSEIDIGGWNGEVLILKDKSGIEIERVDALKGWQAGDNATKETMQKVDANWVTSQPTPKTQNIAPKPQTPNPNVKSNPNDSSFAKASEDKQNSKQVEKVVEVKALETPSIIQESVVKPEPRTTVLVQYPQSIYISEFLPDPEGSDEKGEWIELYNDGASVADIGGFFLDDADGGSKPYKIPTGTKILSKGFLVFNRSDTNIALNNKADEARLLYPDGSIAAKVNYADAKEGESGAYDFVKKELYWTKNPTPGKVNTISSEVKKTSVTKNNYQQKEVKKVEDLTPLELSGVGLDTKNLAASAKEGPIGSFANFWTLLGALLIGAGAAFGYVKFLKKAKIVLFLAFLFLTFPVFASALTFSIAKEFDPSGRASIEADSVLGGRYSIFYVEQGLIVSTPALQQLQKEFDETIYPKLTALLGEPWTPGIDNDSRITILVLNMVPNVGGYFNGEDEFLKSVNAQSNEREMIYLNADFITPVSAQAVFDFFPSDEERFSEFQAFLESSLLAEKGKKTRAFLAHEFQHLITFNQKIKRLGKEEEVWLNEVRSEYAPTFLGYDDDFSGSNLEERMRHFLEQPHDHLTTWNNSRYDYAAVSMFGQYLAARFGSSFYREEMRSDEIGLESVEKTLRLLDPNLTFAKFFSQWRLTNYINNDKILNGKYSYKNMNPAGKNLIFKFAPESRLVFNNAQLGKTQKLNPSIPSFSGKAVSFILGENRTIINVSAEERSPDVVVTYLKELKDGSVSEGQFSMEGGKKELSFSKDVTEVAMLLSNASKNIPNASFTVEVTAKAQSQPSIASIEPVFLKPSATDNVFLVKGEDFDPELALLFNGNNQPFTFQSSTLLTARVSTFDKTIEVKITNPDGGETTLTWENPLAVTTQTAETNQTIQTPQYIPDGTLIRQSSDYKVYII